MWGQGNAAEIAAMLTDQIGRSAMSCELIDSVFHELNGTSVHLLVFDKYFMRNSSRASLTVSVIGSGGTVYVDAVGSGGSQGALFNFSWGAEENFVGTVAEILGSYGFVPAR
jgi:hypothetical protein